MRGSSRMSPTLPTGPHLRRRKGWLGVNLLVLAAAVTAAAPVLWWMTRSEAVQYTTFTVRRGPLEIKVLEGGTLEARESQEIKSEVKGWQGVKILTIVPEGYYVSQEDVKNRKVLVELDSSELQEKLTTSEIEFKRTQSELAEARKGLEIQLNKSESDIYSAQVEVKLTRIEFEKYVGRVVAEEILGQIEEFEDGTADVSLEDIQAAVQPAPSPSELASVVQNFGGGEGEVEAGPEPGVAASGPIEVPEIQINLLNETLPEIDFPSYCKEELLGNGEANQTLRKNEDAIVVAKRELGLSETEYEGKKRLHEAGFITEKELENAAMDVKKKEIALKAAETAQLVFAEYEFRKQGEKLMSDYILARRKLERARKQAMSELAQAQSKVLAAEARYRIEQDRIREYRDQIAKSTMYAKREGLVVYGGSGEQYWNQEPIKEGATVRERQAIITIPDMSTMAVKVKIHESDIKQIKVGQTAKIRVDADAEKTLEGKVTQVAVLPASQDRWMNPDMKVYETIVSIEGVHNWIKPGMSAQVEILINTLPDVTYIPIQSVVPQGDKQVCFVLNGRGEPEPRVIETSEATVEFIVVTKGLEPGEKVLIRPPAGSRQDEREKPGEKNRDEQSAPAVPPAPPVEAPAVTAPAA